MNNNAIFSTMIRAGRTTYSIDIREANNGKKYLSISESQLNGERRQRNTLRVFGEAIDQLRQEVDEAASAAQ